MQAHGEDGDEDVLGNKEGNDAGDRTDGEEPGRNQNRCRREDDLPKPKMDALERTFVANSGGRQWWH